MQNTKLTISPPVSVRDPLNDFLWWLEKTHIYNLTPPPPNS